MKFVPHDYQHEIMDWITSNRRCAVWADMGSGKTVSTLTALESLSLVEPVYPALVLAPLRVATTVWGPEARKWDHLKHLRVVEICGPVKQRLTALRIEADIYTTNYENMGWLLEQTGGKWPFRTVIADELTKLKSFRLRQGGSRAQALAKVAFDGIDRFVGLTGTPAANGLKDLWGQMWFVDRGERLGRTYTAFEQRWFRNGYNGFGLVPLPHAQGEIQRLIRDVCLTVRGQPVDEPIVSPVYVHFQPRIRQYYEELERNFFLEVASGETVTASNAGVRSGKLMQLTNGALYVDGDGREGKTWEEVHDAKLVALESIVSEACGKPLLVAYNFQSDLVRLRQRFPHARALDTNPDTILEWNAGRIPMLLCHPASAGHGLNLAEGGHMLVFYGLNWSLELYQQMIERIGPRRQMQAGHKRPVFIYPIVMRRSIDELILQRLRDKREVQDILLEAMHRYAKRTDFKTSMDLMPHVPTLRGFRRRQGAVA